MIDLKAIRARLASWRGPYPNHKYPMIAASAAFNDVETLLSEIDRLTKERDRYYGMSIVNHTVMLEQEIEQLREQNDLLRSLSKRLTQRIYTLMKDSGELAELVGESSNG